MRPQTISDNLKVLPYNPPSRQDNQFRDIPLKNQYFGDRNDRFKYDLSIFLTSHLPGVDRFTFVPMLTPDDGSTDGSLHSYSQDGRPEELHRFLQNCVRRSWRNIYLLRGYFCAHDHPFTYSPYADQIEFRHGTREQYFDGIPAELCRSAVILLDPDNGLEVPSARPGKMNKYVKYEEVRDLSIRMGDSSVLSVYQHLPREKRVPYFDRIHRELERCAYQKLHSPMPRHSVSKPDRSGSVSASRSSDLPEWDPAALSCSALTLSQPERTSGPGGGTGTS